MAKARNDDYRPVNRLVSRKQDRAICAGMPSPKEQARQFDRATRTGKPQKGGR